MWDLEAPWVSDPVPYYEDYYYIDEYEEEEE